MRSRVMGAAGGALAILVACIAGAGQPALFPGVASVNGSSGTVWRSEAVLFNPSQLAQDATLEIIPRGASGSSADKTYQLTPGESRWLADLYAELDAPSGNGTLRVTGEVAVWVRTYNQGTTGTFGQDIPAADDAIYGPGISVLFATSVPDGTPLDFRSNLVLLSLDSRPQRVQLDIGGMLQTIDLGPNLYVQVNNVGAYVGATPGHSVLKASSTGTWTGYVSTVDPVTGDPTTVRGTQLQSDVPTSGLVLYYPFDGDTDDESGHGHDGVNQGAIPATDRFGRPQHALSFDGVAALIEIPGTSDLDMPAAGLTLAAWVATTAHNDDGVLIGKHSRGYGNGYLLMIVDDHFNAYPPFEWVPSPGVANDGAWHLVVATYDGIMTRLYVDATLTVEAVSGSLPDNEENVTIGGVRAGSRVEALIDDVRVYNRPLAPSEVAALYAEPGQR